VEYLHSKNIVHRDLKPDNVVLSDTDHCKIVDFGVARVLQAGVGAPPTRANSWRSGSGLDEPHDPHATNWVGTGVYTAPEVQLGQYGSAVDIFRWGVMVFEVLMVTNPEPPTTLPGHIHDFMPFFKKHLEHHEVATIAVPLLEKTTNFSPELRGTATGLQEDNFFSGIDWEDLLRACRGGQKDDDVDRQANLSSPKNLRQAVISRRAASY
jgi:serine/threonine protein kinase